MKKLFDEKLFIAFNCRIRILKKRKLGLTPKLTRNRKAGIPSERIVPENLRGKRLGGLLIQISKLKNPRRNSGVFLYKGVTNVHKNIHVAEFNFDSLCWICH